MKQPQKYLFICFTVMGWKPWYVSQQLMSEISKKHKVIYVQQRREIREILAHIFKSETWRLGIKRINDNLLLIDHPPFVPKIYKIKNLDNLIDQLYHFFIKLISVFFGRNCRKLLCIYDPSFSSFRKFYKNYDYVYYVYDLYAKYTFEDESNKNSQLDNYGRQKEELNEAELVHGATLFYAVSDTICDYYQDKYGRRPKQLPNAAVDAYFRDRNKETLLKKTRSLIGSIPNRKIAFCGSIVGSLDLDIVIDSAKSMKDYSFVLIGRIIYTNIKKYDDKVESLLALNNVYHIGPFDAELLTYLLDQMDILTMIYTTSKDVWTYYSFPAKLFEYMAIGKPIISTPQPVINKYRKYISIVESSEQFIANVRNIENFYSYDIFREMVEIARKNKWEDRVNIILSDLNKKTALPSQPKENRKR